MTRLDQIPEVNRNYVEVYIRHKSLGGLSDSTIENYVAYVRRFLISYGDRDIKDITKDDVDVWFFNMRNKNTKQTQKISLLSLHSFFSDALGKDKAKELLGNIHVKVPVSAVREDELLTQEEIQRMISVATSTRDKALISVLYSSGCRSAEILGLKIKDISFSQYGASIHVNGKTGERDVDLFVGVPELKAHYNNHPHRNDGNAPFWCSTRGDYIPMSHAGLWQLLNRVAEHAGIPEHKRWHPHAFRHKRATDCAEIMTAADLKEMFGWTDGSNMTSVYVHSSRKRVAEKLMKQAGIKIPEQKIPTMMVRQCPNCGCINQGDATICTYCSMPLEENRARGLKKLRELIDDEIIEEMDKKDRIDRLPICSTNYVKES